PLVMTVTRNDSTAADSVVGTGNLITDSVGYEQPLADSLKMPSTESPAVDTIYLTADTLFSRLILVKDYIPRVFELDREGGELDEYIDEELGDSFDSTDNFGDMDDLEPLG